MARDPRDPDILHIYDDDDGYPHGDTIRKTPALPEELPEGEKELQLLHNSLVKDIKKITENEAQIRREEGYSFWWLDTYVEPLKRARNDLAIVRSSLNPKKKASQKAKSESLAVRDAIQPTFESLLDTLNGTFIINPIFNNIAKEEGFDTKGYLKDDKIKKIITFYKKTPYVLRSQIELKLEKMKPAQLTTTINMLSNERNALIPKSVVKRLNNKKEKIKAILDVIDNEILLDPSKRGTKTTDGKKRIRLPPRASEIIQEYVGTKKAGIKKQKKRITQKRRNK